MKSVQLILVLGMIILLSSCSRTDIKRASYDALHTRQCIEQTGASNCNTDYPSYDEYQQHREDIPE